jgi:hypothetical protein
MTPDSHFSSKAPRRVAQAQRPERRFVTYRAMLQLAVALTRAPLGGASSFFSVVFDLPSALPQAHSEFAVLMRGDVI